VRHDGRGRKSQITNHKTILMGRGELNGDIIVQELDGTSRPRACDHSLRLWGREGVEISFSPFSDGAGRALSKLILRKTHDAEAESKRVRQELNGGARR